MANGFFQTPEPRNEPIKGYRADSPERVAIKKELKAQEASLTEIALRVGSRSSTGSNKVEVFSPHKHRKPIAICESANERDIESAIRAALDVRHDWSRLPWEERASVFLKAADLLATTYRDKINATTMLGQSKTVFQAEIDAACELIDFYRFNVKYMQQIYEAQPKSDVGIWNRSEARGLEGFVFAITPFNFTSIALNLPTAPALMGCTVIWKPAHTNLLAANIGMRVLEEAGLPPGVINFLPGDAKMIGARLLSDPSLSGVHFTGSTATFNHIWKTIGTSIDRYKTYPRIVGETGGKDFVFAHESADPDSLVTALIRGAFEYQGQKCSAASRAYIPKKLWKKIRAELIEKTNNLRMGDPNDFRNFVGAVIDEPSFDKISGYIERAKNASDAKVVAGGEFDKAEGYFIRPTLIETTNPLYASMVEEIFGPVLTVYPYDEAELDETLKICDESTAYSLTGAIFAKNRFDIHRMKDRLENAAGNFYINDKPTGAVVGQQPFGGSRASGTNDKAGSMWNLLRWTSHRTVKENFVPPTRHGYPFMDEQ